MSVGVDDPTAQVEGRSEYLFAFNQHALISSSGRQIVLTITKVVPAAESFNSLKIESLEAKPCWLNSAMVLLGNCQAKKKARPGEVQRS